MLHLDHEYTQTNLRFDALKGNDCRTVDALFNVKLQDGDRLILHLVLGEKEQTGKDCSI